jgi:hypothetical protein
MDEFKRVSEQHGRGVPRAGAADSKRSAPARRHAPPRTGAQAIDWSHWFARIERHRRRLQRRVHLPTGRLNDSVLVQITCNSFRIDGIEVDYATVQQALSRSSSQRRMRGPQIQRIRTHIAILHRVFRALQRTLPLPGSDVLRWYTCISGGLSVTGPDAQTMHRLEQILRRINSPQLRIRGAIQDVVRTHVQLLREPLFPAFNGILARLLLQYHLGRCGLPWVIPQPPANPQQRATETELTLQVIEGIDRGYQALLP